MSFDTGAGKYKIRFGTFSLGGSSWTFLSSVFFFFFFFPLVFFRLCCCARFPTLHGGTLTCMRHSRRDREV